MDNYLNKNNQILYEVVGRYMSGRSLTGYQVNSSNGKSERMTVDRVIYLTGKNLVTNVKVQAMPDGSLRLRGKGVNLLELKIYDDDKQEFRGENKDNNEKFGAYRVVKRIMRGQSCVGYVVRTHNGSEKAFGREKIMELVQEGLLSNVERFKYKTQTGKVTQGLRGKGINLKELPIVYVDTQANKLIDTEKKKGVRMRMTAVDKGGILSNKQTSEKQIFEKGDYLVCGVNGVMNVIKQKDVWNLFKRSALGFAVCDGVDVSQYSVGFFGQPEIKLNKNMVSKWKVIETI